MPSDSGSAWSPPASTSERRLSNSSDGSAGSGYSKATTDSADFLATRPHTTGVIPGKPAANPLQFIKVGPADLGSRAREQLRRAELAKQAEPARRERQEDWQSNLDNWKSSRRKRVEHIIERCVEVRQMENTPSQPRAKSKTFNEMLEERAGRRRRNPLALYADDDGHDLSDLGIGTSSTKSSLSEDCDTHSLASDGMDLDKNHSDVDIMSNCGNNRKLGSSANEYDTCTTTTISSPEPEEYTYEGAIEGYKSRIISQTNSNIVKTLVNNNKEKSPEKSDLNRIRTSVSNKIEEKVSSFQHERANDSKNNNQKKDLPKVDIHKRREQFEKENSQELQMKPKLPDIANKRSIKDRLSSLEKFTEETHVQKSTNDLTKLPPEVKPLKERLSSLEKVKSAAADSDSKTKRLSNGDLTNAKSLKERLSSLKSQKSEEEERKMTKTEVKEVSMSLKERLSCLDAAKNKDIPKISVEEEILLRCEKIDANGDDMKDDNFNDNSLKSSLTGLENQMQSFCRSLDSLDINGQSSPNSFERVQSLEDFDCAEMQNNTIASDIETEDSGIHTARDSAPADDIADLTQVASPIGEPSASEYESSNEDGVAMELKLEEHIETEKISEPMQTIVQDIIIEEAEEQDRKADDDSASHYAQAVSQPEEFSVSEEITEIQLDKEDEDTLKSLETQDTSVSLNEPVSTASEGDTVVFEGKMTIHLNLNEICNQINAGAGNTNQISTVSTNSKSMPMVTVSNITTITNISPKNSIKPLKIDNTLNTFADITCTSACSFVRCVDNDSTNTTSNDNNRIINVTQSRDIAAPIEHLPVLDALELAFQELDSEDNTINTSNMEDVAKEVQTKSVSSDNPELKKIPVRPLYENIDIFYQSNVETADTFPLDLPTNVLEPPKEKPPPPPMDDANDDLLGNGNFKHTNSARRIKKEIRNKRSSFLGIEGQDDSYLDVDLNQVPRPDITSFLQEETKIEKLLYKKTLSHDMDARLRDSRDSGVDVDRGPSAEAWYKGQSSPEVSNPHSRQNSEPYTHVTVTSDEEECKQNEQHFTTDLSAKLTGLSEASDDKIEHLDKKLQHQQEVLRFERELLQLEQEELRRQRENLLRDQNRMIQKSVQDISSVTPEKPPLNRPKHNNYRHSMPNLLINESLILPPQVPERPIYDENLKRKPFVSEEQLQRHFGVEESRRVLYEERISEENRRSLYEERDVKRRGAYEERNGVNVNRRGVYEERNGSNDNRKGVYEDRNGVDDNRRALYEDRNGINDNRRVVYEDRNGVDNNRRGYEDRKDARNVRLAVQPVLPPKPKSRESIEREITMRSSRVPSAVEYANVDRNGVILRQKPNGNNANYHPMTRHTLQALSAAPAQKMISNAEWIQARNIARKPPNYNQHWLIQEAEQRRIEELKSKSRHSYHADIAPPSVRPSGPPTGAPAAPALHAMLPLSGSQQHLVQEVKMPLRPDQREDKLLTVSGKRKCSHCGEELGRGAAMIIESLSLCYHVWCFTCCVCGARLGDGRGGADVRVRASRLHCRSCKRGHDGTKYSAV